NQEVFMILRRTSTQVPIHEERTQRTNSVSPAFPQTLGREEQGAKHDRYPEEHRPEMRERIADLRLGGDHTEQPGSKPEQAHRNPAACPRRVLHAERGDAEYRE